MRSKIILNKKPEYVSDCPICQLGLCRKDPHPCLDPSITGNLIRVASFGECPYCTEIKISVGD